MLEKSSKYVWLTGTPYWIGLLLIFLMFYVPYRAYFKGRNYMCENNFNIKTKNIGKTIPSFPNGWYVAIRSQLLHKGCSQAIDIAGQNIVVFRSLKGKAYALQAYCKHLGANLGVGGKVINQKCIQCPFHGWLYDGQTGICVDYDGKPFEVKNVQYNSNFYQKDKKLQWKRDTTHSHISLRKYPVVQLNNYIYVWIHALPQHQQTPFYSMIDVKSLFPNFQYRATAIHNVKSHIQDIPSNGADAAHFKYIHQNIIQNNDSLKFKWKPTWMRGDNNDIKSMFEHERKYIRDFKQFIYEKIFQNYPQKKYLSIGNIDNYAKIPIIGFVFFVNITIIQVGSSTVFIFLKSPFFTTILYHYLQPKQKHRVMVYHDGYSSPWLPYWLSALVLKMDALQVSSDMVIWDTKKFMKNICFKQGQKSDQFLIGWTQWYSQYFEGCLEKQKNDLNW